MLKRRNRLKHVPRTASRAIAALGFWLIHHESVVIFVVLEGCVGAMFWAMR